MLLVSYQSSEMLNEENWKQFCMISYHQLYYARKLVKNLKKKWETKKTHSNEVLSPSRVQRGMGDLLKQLPAISKEVKTRGRPSGNQMGAEIITRPDCEVIKSQLPNPKKTRVSQLIIGLRKTPKFSNPRLNITASKRSRYPTKLHR